MTITIDTVPIKTPNELEYEFNDVDKGSYTNVKGQTVRFRLRADVRKFKFHYTHLTEDEVEDILNAISPIFFSIAIEDPLTKNSGTFTAYSGPKKIRVFREDDGTFEYADLEFNIIEK